MRNRVWYGLLLVSVVGLGLASRSLQGHNAFVRNYVGDALWALMVFLGFGFIFRRKSTTSIALMAFLFAVSIELSQLYHAPWLDQVRSTRLGGLVLGFGFLWSDLICYAVGIATGFLAERRLSATRPDTPTTYSSQRFNS